jgi:hypothetical protein
MHETILWLLLLSGSLPGAAQQISPIEQLLRLKPGNYWIYNGTVKWDSSHVGAVIKFSEPNPGKVLKPQGEGTVEITYKVEVLERWVHGPITFYVVSGFLQGLSGYYPGDDDSELHIWAVYGNGFYSLGADPPFLKHIRTPGLSLVEDMNRQTPWLAFPLKEGECPKSADWHAGQPRAFDTLPCSEIKRKQPIRIHAKGVDQSNSELWQLEFVDHHHDVSQIALGVGFVQFDAVDSMVTHEVHVKLVEAHLQ